MAGLPVQEMVTVTGGGAGKPVTRGPLAGRPRMGDW